MDRKEAIQRIWTYRALGLFLVIISLMLLAVWVLKMMYYGDLGTFLEQPVKNLVSFLYFQIPIVSPIISTLWSYVPTPRIDAPLSVENIPLLLIYVALFAGLYLWRAAQNLTQTVKEVDHEIRKEKMRSAARGESTSPTQEDKSIVFDVPSNATFWGQVHEHYLAPLFVGIVLATILYFFGIN